jgi:hypothetical protein
VGRLLRGTFKLAVIAAVLAGVAAVAKKLMGGLGPTPGSDEAPREWPSLVPDPATEAAPASANGAEPAGDGAPVAGTGDPVVTEETDPTP